MKYKVVIARPCTNGTIHQDVCNFVSAAWKSIFTDPDIKDLVGGMIDMPIMKFPTDTARNTLVRIAQQNDADILFMIDEDASPDYNFFKSAFLFLINQPKPSVIGCPYLSGDGECQVFRFVPEHSLDPKQPTWKLLRVARPEAFLKSGMERVASIGTHAVAYDMRVFNQIQKPYYAYLYNEDHTSLTETEDCYAHRQLTTVGVPIFCDWDKWAKHHKSQALAPLDPIPPDKMPEFWKARAKEYFLYHEQGKAELEAVKAATRGLEAPISPSAGLSASGPQDTVPHDVNGWCNDPQAITKFIGSIPDGGEYLELGTWQGKSAIHAARQAQLSGKKITVWTIDTFEGSKDELYHEQHIPAEGLLKKTKDNLKLYNVEKIVKVIKGESTRVAEFFTDESLDVVYLDGGHSFGAVYADIMAWLPKVKVGGILAGDDYNGEQFPGVVKAVKELLPHHTVTGRTWEIKK